MSRALSKEKKKELKGGSFSYQENPVRFLGQKDPLEKGKVTHSRILGLPLWLN